MVHILYVYLIIAALIMGYNLNDDFKHSYIDVFIIPIFWLPYTIWFLLKDFVIKIGNNDYIGCTLIILGIVVPGKRLEGEDKISYRKDIKRLYDAKIQKKGKLRKWLLTKAFKKLGAI